jgi:hypothetical protein
MKFVEFTKKMLLSAFIFFIPSDIQQKPVDPTPTTSFFVEVGQDSVVLDALDTEAGRIAIAEALITCDTVEEQLRYIADAAKDEKIQKKR